MISENETLDGCILMARKILLSEIWNKPPAYFKIFFYILTKVNYSDTKLFPRGTGFFNFKKEQIPGVTQNQVYEFLRWAKTLSYGDSTTQITTQKTTRGIVIKVNNYNKYQNWETYYPQHKNQHENQQLPNTISNKKIKNSNTSYINISLSNKKITKEEREILTNYVKKHNLAKSSVRAYVNAIIKNGDYVDILESERKRLENKTTVIKQDEVIENSQEEENKIAEIQKQIRRKRKEL